MILLLPCVTRAPGNNAPARYRTRVGARGRAARASSPGFSGPPPAGRQKRPGCLHPDRRPGVDEPAGDVVGGRVDIVDSAGEAGRRIFAEQIVDAEREAEAVANLPAQLD